MLVTDAQVHVWAPETPERPWPPPRTRPRPQGPPFSAEELLPRKAEAGVDRAVLVPPSDPELGDLLRPAESGTIAVKATCVPSLVSEGYPFPSLHDRLRKVVAAFGPRRVFWGNDLTRLPCDYREAVTLFTKELTFLDGEDLEPVMGKAISDWLGWT